MSRGCPSDTDELALEFECEYCHERPGAWCRAVRINGTDTDYPQGEGPLAPWLHAARTAPIYAAHRLGSDQGRDHARYVTENRLEKALTTLRTKPHDSTTFALFADWLEKLNVAGRP